MKNLNPLCLWILENHLKVLLKTRSFYFKAIITKKNRREFNLLLTDGKPIGGKWSYDELNRLKLPKNYKLPKLPSISAPKDKEFIF
ncbi:MAG: cryptochrome/photolyase family protein [Gammaproteobacteria bacterium]